MSPDFNPSANTYLKHLDLVPHDEENPAKLREPFRLILSTPRSGSTLLLRIINKTCRESGLRVRCSGDYHPSVYRSLVALRDGLYQPSVFTRRYPIDGPENPSYYNPEMWRGAGLNEDYWRRAFMGMYLKPLFACGDHFCHKSTNLGMPLAFGDSGPDSISDQFMDLIGDTFQKRFMVVFIERPIGEIIDALRDNPTAIQGWPLQDESQLEQSLSEQRDFFKRHRGLFDHTFTRSDILSDPVRVCRALGLQCSEDHARAILAKPL